MNMGKGSFDWSAGWEAPSLSRRTFAKASAVTGAAVGLFGVGGWTRPASAMASDGEIKGIDLDPATTPVPLGAVLGPWMTADPKLLDAMAVRYGTEVAPGNRSEADFLFRWLPMPLFHEAIVGDDAGKKETVEVDLLRRHLWLMHLVGYFGGIWFGKKLDEFNPAAEVSARDRPGERVDPADDSGFADLARYLGWAFGALGVGGAGRPDLASPLAFAEWAIRGDVPPGSAGDVLSPLITLYGYNVGYTDNILRPPHRAYPAPLNPNADAPSPYRPPYNSMIATPPGVLDARFPDFSRSDPEVPPVPPDPGGHQPVWYLPGDSLALAEARAWWGRAQGTLGFERVLLTNRDGVPDPLAVRQAAAYGVGDATWSIPLFLDVKRWDRKSYDEIVAMSIFFVQAVQAAAMVSVAAAALGDPGGADRATRAGALVQPFGGSYLVGLNERGKEPYRGKSADDALPRFRYKNA